MSPRHTAAALNALVVFHSAHKELEQVIHFCFRQSVLLLHVSISEQSEIPSHLLPDSLKHLSQKSRRLGSDDFLRVGQMFAQTLYELPHCAGAILQS